MPASTARDKSSTEVYSLETLGAIPLRALFELAAIRIRQPSP